MYVPQARIKFGTSRPGWFGGKAKKNRLPSRKLKWYEFVRMPYLVPNFVASVVGFVVLCSGAVLCYIGYNPENFFSVSYNTAYNNTEAHAHNGTHATSAIIDQEVTRLKSLAYVGPILMGIGFFVLMVAVVLYCEIKDTFVHNILPKRNIDNNTRKSVLYDMVIEEFRKNYFRGIEVPIKTRRKSSNKVASELPTLYKALSISTPAILITPEVRRKWCNGNKLTPKHKRRRRHSDNETWLKTSSMPNIRPKSFRRIQRRLSKFSKNSAGKPDFSKTETDKNNESEKEIEFVETNQQNPDTCFSNPAFRTSPTEPIELNDIITNVLNEQLKENKQTQQTHVVVHNDSIKTASDTRGLTQRRHSHIGNVSNEIDNGEETPILKFVKQPPVILYPKNDGLRMSHKNKSSHKSFDHLDVARRGPYKTCIGIVRSESCLHRIRNFVHKFDHGDGENSSLDSLTLNDETMKYFEQSSLNVDSEAN